MANPRAEIPIVVLANESPTSPVAGATATIKNRIGGTEATVFADSGATNNVVTQPLSTDSTGKFTGWLARGAYEVLITIPGQTPYTEHLDVSPSADGGIDSAWLATNSIITEKLNALAVTTAKLGELSVTTPKLAASAVTSEKLASNAVTSAKILGENVVNGSIAAEAVSTTKIANLGVTTAKLSESSVTTAKLGNGAVTEAKIGNSAVGANQLATTAKNLFPLLSGASGSQMARGQFNIFVNSEGNSANTPVFHGMGVTPNVQLTPVVASGYGGRFDTHVTEENSSFFSAQVYSGPLPEGVVIQINWLAIS